MSTSLQLKRKMTNDEDTTGWRYDLEVGQFIDSKHDGEWTLSYVASLSTPKGHHHKNTLAGVMQMDSNGRGPCGISYKLLSPNIQQAYAKTGTPLHRAALEGHAGKCRALIQLGAKVNAKCKIGFTPLMGAASKGHTDVCALLTAQGADINARDEVDLTPLHMSASAGQFGVCELLLRLGAQVNAQANDGTTPIQSAGWNRHGSVCALLANHGAVIVTHDHHEEIEENDEQENEEKKKDSFCFSRLRWSTF